MKARLFDLLRIAVPVCFLAWLVYDMRTDESTVFQDLRDTQKRWDFLTLAVCTYSTVVLTGIVRWFLLVRALQIPFRFRDGLRLGILGYLFNFVSLGSVGGDLFKAIFVANENAGRRVEAISSIVVDRIIGLYGLLIVASVSLSFVDFPNAPPQLSGVARAVFGLTVVGAAAIFVMFASTTFYRLLTHVFGKLPLVGPLFQRSIGALEMYRDHRFVMIATIAMSCGMHCCMAMTLYFLANGFYPDAPTVSQHFIISPIANVVAALPVAPSGLGTYETAMKFLYDWMPAGKRMQDMGLIVALGYRVVTIVTAGVAVCVYLSNRQQVAELLEKEPRGKAA